MIRLRYVAWDSLIGGLIDRGYYTQTELARALNVAESSLRHWRHGVRLPHVYGEALVREWEMATGQPVPEKSS